MATRVRIKWRKGAFKDIRTLPGVQAAVAEVAQKAADMAGDGFEATPVEVSGGRGRARAAVIPVTMKARNSDAKHHTLTRVSQQVKL